MMMRVICIMIVILSRTGRRMLSNLYEWSVRYCDKEPQYRNSIEQYRIENREFRISGYGTSTPTTVYVIVVVVAIISMVGIT